MRFKKITIENFKSIGSEPITVDLDFNNTVLLTGKNGSGKSTIFESIVWCIYGVTKLKADNVVNKFIGKNTKVEIEFSEGGNDYIITRYRKHDIHKNNVYLFKNGENITLKNSSDTQELIQGIIGVDIRAFLSSIILSSETYKQFLRETNSVRLQIFESVFSLKELNDFKKETYRRIKELEAELNSKNLELVSTKGYNDADTKALKSYKENYQTQITKLDSQIAAYELELSRCEEEFKNNSEIDFDKEFNEAIEYQAKLTVFNNELKNVERLMGLINTYSSQISELYKKKEEYDNILKTYSVDFFKAELSKNLNYDKNVNLANEINSKIVETKSKVSRCEDGLDSVINELTDLLKEKIKIDGELNNIKTNICPTCGHVLDESKVEELKLQYAESLEKIERERKELIIKRGFANDKIKEYNNSIEELNNKLSEIDLSKPELSQQEIKYLAQKYKEASENISSIDLKTKEKENELLELKQKVKATSTVPPAYNGHTIEWLNNNKDSVVRIKSRIETLKAQIESTNEMKKAAFDKEYVKKLMTSIKERSEAIKNLESSISELKRDMEQFNALDTIFSNGEGGFKKYFINNIIDMFNDHVNMFLPFFFDDEISIKFDKDLNDTITYRNKSTEFDELSSGEKTRCELCIVFSLYFMVKTLFGTGESSIMVIDEIIDRGLDDKGVIASKQILDDIAKDTAIFVVTHRDDLKELFTSSITVYKDGDGFTKIKK